VTPTAEGGCRLYLVTPPQLVPASFAGLLAAALDAGDVGAVQLRLKDATETEWRRAIDALRPVAQSRGVAFLLNDRPDLAVAHGCDGAHVGQDDTPAAIARKLLGELTLGVTCHNSRDLAFTAGDDGADYVAFGAFFPSPTKQTGTVLADVETLQWWAEIAELPSVAIGGITPENCAPLVQAGADFLAVVSAVWSHPDGPAEGVRAMNAAIAAAQNS
jgi:thiamine-phosphate pyrophosphorylase